MVKHRKPFPRTSVADDRTANKQPPKKVGTARDFASLATILRGEGSATILVLSGTIEECKKLVEAHDIVLWAWVRKELTVRKYSRLSRVLKYGSWETRPDLAEIEATIKARGLIVDIVKKRAESGHPLRDRFAGHVKFPTLKDLE